MKILLSTLNTDHILININYTRIVLIPKLGKITLYHHKLFKCTLYTLNYHTYHILHLGVTFTVMFNGIILYTTRTYICLGGSNLKNWNTLLPNQLKQKPIFSTSLSLSNVRASLFQIHILVNPKSSIWKLLLLHHHSTISPSSLQHRNTICPPFQIGTSPSLAYHTLSISRFSLKKKKKNHLQSQFFSSNWNPTQSLVWVVSFEQRRSVFSSNF